MIGSPYNYAAEKFTSARHALMLPHPAGEAASIASAFFEIDLGLHDVEDQHLDDSARHWLRTLREFMDTSGIKDPAEVGTFNLKAEKLTDDEKADLSRAVDELASWFDRKADHQFASSKLA